MTINKKEILFGVLNITQGIVVGLIPLVVPSRVEAVNWTLYVAASLMILSGPMLVFAGTWGRRLAAGVCLLYWLMGLLGALLVGMSASYLYGIYGHHGHAAGGLAVFIAFALLILFWLVPGHELHYLKNHGGAK